MDENKLPVAMQPQIYFSKSVCKLDLSISTRHHPALNPKTMADHTTHSIDTLYLDQLVVRVQLPTCVKQMDKSSCNEGYVRFDAASSTLIWEVGKVKIANGHSQQQQQQNTIASIPMLSCLLSLYEEKEPGRRMSAPLISLQFVHHHFVASGLRVGKLQISTQAAQPATIGSTSPVSRALAHATNQPASNVYKGFRSVTKTGRFHIRS